MKLMGNWTRKNYPLILIAGVGVLGILFGAKLLIRRFQGGQGISGSPQVSRNQVPDFRHEKYNQDSQLGKSKFGSGSGGFGKSPDGTFPLISSTQEFENKYGTKNLLIRRAPDGRVKRILGVKIPLPSVTPATVVEFAKSLAPILGLGEKSLASAAQLVQSNPMVKFNEGVRIFRIQQELDGYAVVHAAMNVYVDFSDKTVTLIEAADLQQIHGDLSDAEFLTHEDAWKKAESANQLKLSASGPTFPEVMVSSGGKPSLIYRFTAHPDRGLPSPKSVEIWVDASSGKKVKETPIMIVD